MVLGAEWLSKRFPFRPNSNSAEFRASVILNYSCCGVRIELAVGSQAVWNSNCLVEGGSTPLGLEVISQIRDDPSLDLRIQGPQKQTTNNSMYFMIINID